MEQDSEVQIGERNERRQVLGGGGEKNMQTVRGRGGDVENTYGSGVGIGKKERGVGEELGAWGRGRGGMVDEGG